MTTINIDDRLLALVWKHVKDLLTIIALVVSGLLVTDNMELLGKVLVGAVVLAYAAYWGASIWSAIAFMWSKR